MKRVFALVLAVVPMVVFAHDYTVGDVTIAHPAARPTAAMAQTGAGYMSITNTGDTTDTLVAVTGDFPRIMLHNSVMEDDLMRMQALDRVDIAPGETVTFAPGGMHVMFMGLNGDPFEVGDNIPATLVFENAGSIDVVFKVEDGDDGDHSNH